MRIRLTSSSEKADSAYDQVPIRSLHCREEAVFRRQQMNGRTRGTVNYLSACSLSECSCWSAGGEQGDILGMLGMGLYPSSLRYLWV